MRPSKKSAAIAAPTLSAEEIRQRIAEKAYELYLNRGQFHGHDLEDWHEAEQMVLAELSAQAGTASHARMIRPVAGREAGKHA